MLDQTSCPSCRALLQFNANASGKRVRCSKCSHIFVMPTEADLRPVALPRVFISHSHEDRAFVVDQLKGFLQQHGLDPWWSHEDIKIGDPWNQEITKALEQCEWIIVVMSPRAVASDWVRKEMEWAVKHRRDKLLPVLMEPCDISGIHPQLGDIQHTPDFSQHQDDARRRILESLVKQLNREATVHKRKLEVANRKIETLEQDCEFLKKDSQQKDATIRGALDFDGNWSIPPRSLTPPFVPLARRGTRIISFFNLKGGVGKSTLTANVGATLWGPAYKKKVLLIDLDYQGSTTRTCLDPRKTESLRRQKRTSGQLFQSELPANLLQFLEERITDGRCPNHEADIVGTDEELHHAETQAMLRWLLTVDSHDVRYRLRSLLHTSFSDKRYDMVLIDCPPRLTCGTMNALLASDLIVIPTLLDELSMEAVPRLLSWLNVRANTLFPHLQKVGVVINRAKGVNREKEEYDQLKSSCADAWRGTVKFFRNWLPTFPELSMSYAYPAHHSTMRERFANLTAEILGMLDVPPAAGEEAKTQKQKV